MSYKLFSTSGWRRMRIHFHMPRGSRATQKLNVRGVLMWQAWVIAGQTVRTTSSHSGRIMLCVLGKSLNCNVQVHVLSYPVRASRSGLWLNTEHRLNFSWRCSRPISACYCSWVQLSTLVTGLCFSPSAPHSHIFAHMFSVGVPGSLPSCAIHHSIILQKQKCLEKKKYPWVIFYLSFTKKQHGEKNQSRDRKKTSQKSSSTGKKENWEVGRKEKNIWRQFFI